LINSRLRKYFQRVTKKRCFALLSSLLICSEGGEGKS
jgi:hypothetical protein